MTEELTAFDEDDELESAKSQIKAFLEKLKKLSVNLNNVGNVYNEVRSALKIISAQIENDMSEYKQVKTEYDDMKEDDIIKQAMEKKFIPLDMFKVVFKMHNRLKNVSQWYIYESELFTVFSKKLYILTNEAKDAQVMNQTLKEMKEFIKQQNELFKDTMTNKINNIDEKILSRFDKMLNDMLIINKETMNNMLITMSDISDNNINFVREISKGHEISNVSQKRELKNNLRRIQDKIPKKSEIDDKKYNIDLIDKNNNDDDIEDIEIEDEKSDEELLNI